MKITLEELEKLLKDSYDKGYKDGQKSNTIIIDTPYNYDPPKPFVSSGKPLGDTIPEACKNCSNHPSNGGDGICNCILGITPMKAIVSSDNIYSVNYTC